MIKLEVGHDRVGQAARLAQARYGGQMFLVHLLIDPAEILHGLMGGADQGFLFGIGAARLIQARHLKQRKRSVAERAVSAVRPPGGTIHAFEQHLDAAVGQAQQLKDFAHHPHGKQIVRAGLFHIRLFLRHQKNLLAVIGDGTLNGFDRRFPSHKQRHDGVRKHHHLAQRHDRQFHRRMFAPGRRLTEKSHTIPRK